VYKAIYIMVYFNEEFYFASKAITLATLQLWLKASNIAPLYHFTHEEWNNNKQACLQSIQEAFPAGNLIVRSSAVGEDSAVSSMAGAYRSILDVDGQDIHAIEKSIDDVFASYGEYNPQNRALIQRMLSDIRVSGVLFTHDPQSSSPYYVINYDDESGKTDTVTSGRVNSKAVLIWKDTNPDFISPAYFKKLIEAVKEIEERCQSSLLDIEFAIDGNGDVWTFQVRPLLAQPSPIDEEQLNAKLSVLENKLRQEQQRRDGIWGEHASYSNMADWNPAEMIGKNPTPLAYSLYHELITDAVWHQARQKMGYRSLPERTPLMTEFSREPYIDVRASLNSFLPADLPEDIGEKLVEKWLSILKENPALHDKLEFQICATCYDPTFQAAKYGDVLTAEELKIFERSLLSLTNANVTSVYAGTLDWCAQESTKLVAIDGAEDIPTAVLQLIEDCKSFGTLPFSVAARHAFIGESIFRGLNIPSDIAAECRSAIQTIATKMVNDFSRLADGSLSMETFLETYGHVRPNTYNITSLRYDQMQDAIGQLPLIKQEQQDYTQALPIQAFSQERIQELNQQIQQHGYTFTFEQFLDYFVRGTQLRELIKFRFTKGVSDVLEMLATWGADRGLDRKHMSHVSIEDIRQLAAGSKTAELLTNELQARVHESKIQHPFRLPDVISEPQDLYVITLQAGKPNFVTHAHIVAPVYVMPADGRITPEVCGKIVLIESADPGYDWIFNFSPAGLVTKYGGSNSHMTIRCRELGIPAAIGCGEAIYNDLIHQDPMEIDCVNERIGLGDLRVVELSSQNHIIAGI
jgi:hypothetical protein